MIRRIGLDICLLGFLVFTAGCFPKAETTLSPGSPDDLPACYGPFPSGTWESVYKIDVMMARGVSSSLLGVTKGESTERTLHSVLLTPEGFILFDAELREGGVTVRRAVAPFDSPAFARGLMEDVALLLLPPRGKPETWGKEADGTRVCRWESPDGSRTEVRGEMGKGWRILRRDDRGEVIREVSLSGPFVQGLPFHMELRASKPASYTLRMTRVQPAP